MSLLINLLPDLRQAKLRERRRRQLVSGVAVVVWIVCGSLIAILGLWQAGQKVVEHNLTSDIASKESQIKDVTGLVDALTAEEHLESLSSLYDKRVYWTKFFTAYIQSDPNETVLNSLNVAEGGLLTVNGVATSYASVAKLARAMQGANVTVGTTAAAANSPYFTDVNITTVAKSSGNVQFTITSTIDPGATNGSK